MPKRENYEKVRGYDMKVRRTGNAGPLDYETQHAWSPAGQLPEEWNQVKQDESVESAEIYYSNQRSRRADKRSIIEKFLRG